MTEQLRINALKLLEAMFEQAKDGLYTGHAPNYMEVGVAADGLHNVILDVKITGVDGEILRGELT